MNAELTLADYLQMFRRRWAVILAVFGVIMIAATLFTLASSPVYESSASVLLRTNSTNPLFPPVGAAQRANVLREPGAEAEFAATSQFVQQALESTPSGIDVTVEFDDNRIIAVRRPTLDFVARGGDAEAVQRGAQAWADTYLATRSSGDVDELAAAIESLALQIDELEVEKAIIQEPLKPIDDALLNEDDTDAITRLTAQRLAVQDTLEDQLLPITIELRNLTTELSRLRVTQTFVEVDGISARAGEDALLGIKVAPSVARNLALGGMLGLLAGLGVALLLESLRTAIADRHDVERLLGEGMVLAEIPLLDGDPRQPSGPNAEQYQTEIERVVSAVVNRTQASEDGLRLLVTSSRPTEGKSTLSYEIGRRLGLGQIRTLLIDADLRRPTLHGYFGLSNRRAGLSDLLGEGAGGRIMTAPITDNPHLRFLPAGKPTDESPRLLRTNLASVLDRVSDEITVVIDSPPTAALADAEIIADQCDWVIVVGRVGVSTQADLQMTAQRIAASRAELLGVVLFGTTASKSSYSYYSVQHERDDAGAAARRGDRPSPRLERSNGSASDLEPSSDQEPATSDAPTS